MNLLKVIRASEWWEYKLPTLIAIGYAMAVQADLNILDLAPWLAFLLLSLVSGAAYVSVINDFTDLDEDVASGKKNRLIKFNSTQRWLILIATLIPGIICGYFLSVDLWTFSFFILSYLAFSLYSIPPFRFKKKGFAGVMADACGAHLFPSLFIACGTAHFLNIQKDPIWFVAVGLWSLMYGLRGILWHQFSDREFDKSIQLRTFALSQDPSNFRSKSIIILTIEIIALLVMLVYIGKLLPFIALAGYLILIVGYAVKMDVRLIAIIPPVGKSWHILLSTFYQVFLPISLILHSAISYPIVLFLLAIHLIIFPVGIKNLILDYLKLLKSLKNRKTYLPN